MNLYRIESPSGDRYLNMDLLVDASIKSGTATLAFASPMAQGKGAADWATESYEVVLRGDQASEVANWLAVRVAD